MSEMQIPAQIPVQSKKTLGKAGAIAAVIAAIISVCFILPAEYNIDPTGIGRALGLTALSGNAPKETQSSDTQGKIVYTTKDMSDYTKDVVIVHVPAGKGVEYKFNIKQGEKLQYSWSVQDAALFYDFHGEQKGGVKGYYESFYHRHNKICERLVYSPL